MKRRRVEVDTANANVIEFAEINGWDHSPENMIERGIAMSGGMIGRTHMPCPVETLTAVSKMNLRII